MPSRDPAVPWCLRDASKTLVWPGVAVDTLEPAVTKAVHLGLQSSQAIPGRELCDHCLGLGSQQGDDMLDLEH